MGTYLLYELQAGSMVERLNNVTPKTLNFKGGYNGDRFIIHHTSLESNKQKNTNLMLEKMIKGL